MVSVEIGHGSVLIRHPSSIARDEESEASSLSVDNKQLPSNEAYSYSDAPPVHNVSRVVGFSSPGFERMKNHNGQGMQPEQLKSSCSVLNVLNYEEFIRHSTNEEQQILLKYLSPVDAVTVPDSPRFKDNLIYFRQLLVEGVFDISISGAKSEDCKTLKRLALFDLTKSKWVENYQKCKSSMGGYVVSGSNATAPSNLTNVKRLRDSPSQNPTVVFCYCSKGREYS
ncbi:GATA transcription factor 26-like [Carya illinoinensis]|uniref:GATA transcription factor 26-like n=1 Tax=Carya illinoinensis TaxID=32201 RepID=UPI001C71B485|nr:GATA transcription factor 26-like [Carya illinoinensis]